MDKKAKAEAKRARRSKLKQGGDATDPPETPGSESETPDSEPETPGESN